MSSIRSLVLDFSNSCLNGKRHTKEEFDHVIAENHNYERLVSRYEVAHDVYTEAYASILRTYRQCLDGHKFLTVDVEVKGESA